MRSHISLPLGVTLFAFTATAYQSAPQDLPVPTRQLEWKDANFLSISDSHGWLLGHQHATWPEPNYSGDYGTFASFVSHMRRIAEEKEVDLLLVDAGDHHDGSGLVSSSATSASSAEDIFSLLSYDIITCGNHELYKYRDAYEEWENQERWHGRYVTSNVNITIPKGDAFESVPLGQTHIKFTTKLGRKVTAFGVIFDFKAHDKGITVQKPSKLVEEEWFQDVITEAPDYFVVAGHMPVRGETGEFMPIFDAIRKKHPKVPVYFFGGHTHVRDCVQYDDRSIGVVPGRYLESVAFTSSSLPSDKDDGKPLDVARRYLDANPVSYKWHTNTTDDTFNLDIGRRAQVALARLSSSLKITKLYGLAPHDYFLTRHPWGHPRSVATLFSDKVIPEIVEDKERGRGQKGDVGGERLVVGNAGSLRFDLFQGRFDRNDELTVSPFGTTFLYTRLLAGLARNITDQMNRNGASKLVPSLTPSTPVEEEARVQRIYQDWMKEQALDYELQQEETRLRTVGRGDQAVLGLEGVSQAKPRTLGFVTKDKCPGKGDDIEHIPVPFQAQPDFVSSPFPEDMPDDQEMDVVCMDFALDDFLTAVNTLDPTINLQPSHMKPYAEGLTIQDVFGKYAEKHWRKGL
ncbi:hypothetical protein L202_02229 [Cryptococcus amylolentus CBS 6039]|uniref:Uncharacterized protein n=1 Tax=Cryptococcus amylolentus CBS 6039 TaxID=1295533 RepID=A0A1E3HZW6_9TREE|nr:hypothetical protein L202_02229 [Cryptococcus amylolentus CBS 6039]ODN81879.1 hypothetical protein L202_02229 [Cryptococcus amylolentus CBS 6039]